MEVTGEFNPKSTPETRVRDRNRAEALGTIQKIVTAQPMLCAYVVLALLAAGRIQSVYNP
jgi:hypothetical protein